MNDPAVDAEGYLINPQDWTEEWALTAARGENIEMTQDHWTVVRFMREYLEEHQAPPDARFVIRHLAQTAAADRNRLFELFPYGYVQQACRIAGMRRPRIWSTG